tara:strand:+ start:26 stop:514 length:489 start_codon:yes stop_codon:yes gene_type:complete
MSTLEVKAIQAPTGYDLDMPAGAIIQVVQTSDNASTETTATATWVDVGPTATITPKFSNSKIMVMHSAGGIAAAEGVSQSIQLLRGSTVVRTSPRQGYTQGTGFHPINWEFKYLDSPATTSAITYKFQIRQSSTGNLRHNNSSGSGVTAVNGAVTILMEVAG